MSRHLFVWLHVLPLAAAGFEAGEAFPDPFAAGGAGGALFAGAGGGARGAAGAFSRYEAGTQPGFPPLLLFTKLHPP